MSASTGFAATAELPLEVPTRSGVDRLLRWTWIAGLAVLLALMLGLAALVATGKLYRPGDDIGYNLGLVGGLLMLSLLLYPLRKRIRTLDRLGAMPHWFRYHMVAGIGGPLLVVFHSTFRIGSMNGSIALYAMLLVALSGLVGRFVYRHIHQGLYGRKLTIAEAEQELKTTGENVRSVIALVPTLERRLKRFHNLAFAELPGVGARVWRFMTLRWRGHRLVFRIRREAKRALKHAMLEQHWSRAEASLHWRLAKRQITAYVDAVCQAAQFSVWERLFSLWHVVHIPFLYLLLFSGIVHVIAVHMY